MTYWATGDTITAAKLNGSRNLGIGSRNCVTGAPSVAFITGSGSALTAGITGPIDVTFANGFNSDGSPSDATAQIATNASFWTGIPASSTPYLYIDYNNGTPNGGYSVVPPRYLDDPTAFPGLPVATQADAISGGDTAGQPKANAFDGNLTTYWLSSQTGSSANGTAYIGQDLGAAIYAFKSLTIKQYGGSNGVTSAFIEITADGTNWTTLQTQTLAGDSSTQTVTLSANSNQRAIRLRANALPGGSGSNAWAVYEITITAIATGQHVYSPRLGKMQSFDGTNWNDQKRVFPGEVATNGTNVTGETSYAVRGFYDSGWFAIAGSTNYAKAHNIGYSGSGAARFEYWFSPTGSDTDAVPWLPGSGGWYPLTAATAGDPRLNIGVGTGTNVNTTITGGTTTGVTSGYGRIVGQRAW